MTSILVVEDEQVVALDIEYTLLGLGYAVPAIAGNAAEALWQAERTHPDVALMDIRLSGEMDGVDAAGLMRDRLGLPVIFLTAYSDDHTLQRAQAADPYGYLVKPFNRRALRTAIEIAVHKHATELKLARLEAGQRFLATASKALSASLDPGTIIDELAHTVVGHFGDGCAVQLARGDCAFSHVDPSSLPRFEAICRSMAAESAPRRGVCAHVQRSCTSVLIGDVPADCDTVDPGTRAYGIAELGQIARSLVCVPITTANGAALGTLTVVRATTHSALDAADVTLAEDVAQRVSVSLENARLYRDASDARKARDLFIAMAAHELKGPVTVLKLQVDLAMRALAKTLPDSAQEAHRSTLDKFGRTVARLGLLISNVLNVSALSAGFMDLHLETVDLTAVTREIVEQMRPEAERAGGSIALHCADDPIGYWDRLRIEQIVSNLVSNAIKYGRDQPIEVAVSARDGIATLSVQDHGIGIAPEHRTRIFEPFERAVGDGAFTGIGMGLWIVRQIVSALGGTTELSSELGRGSTFTVRLPITRSEARDRC